MRVSNDEVVNDVSGMNLNQVQQFDITDPQKFINLILDNTYKDPIEATIRELSQNASDPELGQGGAFEFHLPTTLEPWMAIVDNGTGLSVTDVFKYFSGLGASTKDQNNTQVGGFGIGCKVPFTMADQYTVISRHEGEKHTFSAYKDEYGQAQFVQLSTQPTTEVNGIEVRVPVEEKDFRKVREKAIRTLRYFDPKPTTNIEVEWGEVEFKMQGSGWGYRKGSGYREESRIIMGNLWYPIDTDKVVDDWKDPTRKVLNSGFDLHFDIGSIDLPLSREDILYSPRTLKAIKDRVTLILEEFTKNAQKEVDSKCKVWDALDFIAGNDVVQHLDLKLTWRGQPLSNFMMVDLPKGLSLYQIDAYKFRRKTLAISDRIVFRDKHDRVKLNHTEKEVLWYVLGSKEKRKPSRLLAHVKSLNKDHFNVRVVEYEEGVCSVAQAVKWIKKHTNHNHTLFSNVPDIAPPSRISSLPAAQRKKYAKVKVMKFKDRYWGGDKDWWVDHDGDLDLDNNTGIYVDLKRNIPQDESWEYKSNSKVWEVVQKLKRFNLIPKDTVIYGCPANVKNKLKDHPNYMSVVEAVELADTLAFADITPSSLATYKLGESMKDVFSDLNLPLDIDVNAGYYKRCRKVIDKLHSINADYVGYVVDKQRDGYQYNKRLNKITKQLTTKLTKEYPLLERGYSRIEEEDVVEYVKMKSYIMEKGIQL